MTTTLSLRDYQKDAIHHIDKAFEKGVTKQVAVLATGLGKTVIFSHLISQRILQLHKKALIIAHREELLQQAKDKLTQVNPGLRIGIEQADRTADHTLDDVVIASVATIGRDGSPRLLAFDPYEYNTIIIDEAHHASADSYRTILKHFGVLKNTSYDWNKEMLLLGVTATPNRNDNHGIDQIFDDVTYQYHIIDAIQHNWLSRIKALRITTGFSLDTVSELAGDFKTHELAQAINTHERNMLVVETYKEKALGKSTLVFAADVDHAQNLFDIFIKAGIKTGLVLGDTDKKKREELLRKFANGELQVMVNAMVLTEGYDNARIAYIFMARPTKSGILYHQMIGRGTRIHPEKTHLTIVDFVDNTKEHKIQTSSSLLGLEGAIDFQGEDILLYKNKLDLLREKRPFYTFDVLHVKNIDALLEEVDVLQQAEEKRINTPFVWHKYGDILRIGVGSNRYFAVEQSLTGQYQLSQYTSHIGTRSYIGTFLTSADAVRQADYLIAQGFGSISGSVYPQEPWRKDIPTEAQVQLLRSLGVSENEILMLDKGGASQLISKMKLRKKYS